jgi:hypothetical protein
MPPKKKVVAKKIDTVGDIEFLEEEPPLPRKHDRDDQFWRDVKAVIDMKPNTWAKVKVYDKENAAAQKASIINNNRNKMFPSDKYEARYTREDGTSILYLLAIA